LAARVKTIIVADASIVEGDVGQQNLAFKGLVVSRDLAAREGVSAPVMTRALDRAEQAGLIVRSPSPT
jgi:DNA-binding MarR family transcriptional regulator